MNTMGYVIGAIFLVIIAITFIGMAGLDVAKATTYLEDRGFVVAPGTFALDLAAILAKTNLIPATPADEATSTAIYSKLGDVKTKTDLIPSSGIADNATLLSIKTETDKIAGIGTNVTTTMNSAANNANDLAVLEQKWDAKPRPYPYDTGAVLSCTSNSTTVNAFPTAYTSLIPAGTYSFGDTPNGIQISGLCIEGMDTSSVYILEFYRSTDAVTYTPIGALRFSSISTQTRSFTYALNGRELNADTETLYARLKSTPANKTVTFSLTVHRHISTTEHVPTSTGVFPLH